MISIPLLSQIMKYTDTHKYRKFSLENIITNRHRKVMIIKQFSYIWTFICGYFFLYTAQNIFIIYLSSSHPIKIESLLPFFYPSRPHRGQPAKRKKTKNVIITRIEHKVIKKYPCCFVESSIQHTQHLYLNPNKLWVIL